jgi:hypothetical protein
MMKQVVFYALAAGLVLSSGCSKKEEAASKEAMPAATVAEQAQAVTAQAQAVTKEAARKAQAAVSALTVKSEEVMAELNLPVADIKTKAAGYGQSELLGYANAYKDVILAKKEQWTALTQTLKGLPMADMIGEKGKAIKAELSQYNTQLAGLKERYSVYLDLLKKFGVDISSFGI